MLKEFREFAMRGNVLDLAIAVIIGGAFGKIITSLVNDVLMPLIGLVFGGINFSDLSITVGAAVVKWGAFVQSIIDFLIVAFVIFMLVRAMNRLQKPAPVAAPTTKDCPYCFTLFRSMPPAARTAHHNFKTKHSCCLALAGFLQHYAPGTRAGRYPAISCIIILWIFSINSTNNNVMLSQPGTALF